MKKLFLSLVVAALFGMPFATARDASGVRVSVKQQAGKPVVPQKLGGQSINFNGVEGVMAQHKSGGWYVVNVPLAVKATTKVKDDAGNPLTVHYIPSLKLKIHLLFKHQDENAGKPRAAMLSKELTYIDIPVPNKGKQQGVRENEIYAGVFISPSDAWKISEKTKGELDKSLVGLAVEASFNDAKCWEADREKHPQAIVYDKVLEREWNISGKWWEKTGVDNAGAQLRSINETPYAYAAGDFYPQLEPVSAGAVSGAPSMTSSVSGSSDSSVTGADSTESTTATADDSAGVEVDAADEPKEGKRTRGKRSKSKRRGSSL